MDKKIKSETLVYGVGKYASILVTLLTTTVLSRILSPSEYGIVAITTVFSSFFNVIADMGFGTAVIQNKSLTDEEINDIFSFSILISIGLGLVFALLGIPISLIYENRVYLKICPLLGLAVFFSAINIVPHGKLMREKRFKLMGIRLISVSLFSGVLAIGMAYAGLSYYALVFQTIIYAALVFLWNLLNAHLKIRLRFHFESIRKILSYSMNQFAFSILNYGEKNLDNLLIGKSLGAESLAFYDKGFRLMMYPVQNLTYVITPVLHPILADHQDDRKYIYDAYIKVTRVLSLLGVFISAFCFWNRREIILFFFGSQWTSSISLFGWLSLSVWPQMISASAASIYQSTGNTKLLFRSSLVHTCVTLILILLGVHTGELERVAQMVTLAIYIRFFVEFYFLVVRNFGFSYKQFLLTFSKDVLIFAAMIAVMAACSFIRIESIILSMAVKGSILAGIYLPALMLTGQLHWLLSFLNRKRRKS